MWHSERGWVRRSSLVLAGVVVGAFVATAALLFGPVGEWWVELQSGAPEQPEVAASPTLGADAEAEAGGSAASGAATPDSEAAVPATPTPTPTPDERTSVMDAPEPLPDEGGAPSPELAPEAEAVSDVSGLLAAVAAHAGATEPGLGEADLRCPDHHPVMVGGVYVCEADPPGAEPRPLRLTIHDVAGKYHVWPSEEGAEVSSVRDVFGEVGPGALCADVHDAGYSYEAAVGYWLFEGSPTRMDATNDGVPCTTVYPADVIDGYWQRVRTAPVDAPGPAAPVPAGERPVLATVVGDLRDTKPRLAGAELRCPDETPLVVGRVYVCEADPADGGPPLLQLTIHDGLATYHTRLVHHPDEVPQTRDVYDEVGSGALCADVHAADHPYDVAVAYWLAEGSPSRMDATKNGVPCTTVYPAEAIDDYWQRVRETVLAG